MHLSSEGALRIFDLKSSSTLIWIDLNVSILKADTDASEKVRLDFSNEKKKFKTSLKSFRVEARLWIKLEPRNFFFGWNFQLLRRCLNDSQWRPMHNSCTENIIDFLRPCFFSVMPGTLYWIVSIFSFLELWCVPSIGHCAVVTTAVDWLCTEGERVPGNDDVVEWLAAIV